AGVRFDVRLDQVGKSLQQFVVTARPASTDLHTGHNSRALSIKVEDARPKVLLVDEQGRWEYHYLASALVRDRGLQVERVLFQPPLLNPRISAEDLETLGNPRRTLLLPKGALADYQCVILGDVTPPQQEREFQMSDKDWEDLEKYVKDHGGTLVL